MYGLLRSEDAWSPALIWSQNKLYGSNTVDHVMSGKAFARAVRGHVIVQEQDAIVQLLLQRALNGECHSEVINRLQVLYGRVWTDKVVVDDCTLLESEDMNLITSKLPSVVCMLSAQLRTSKLWIQYVHYVDIMKLFIYAERTSDWYLYLYASESMLNLFAATGHFHYAKACRIYVQQMRALSSEQPDLLEHFVNGKQSIRRSDRLWASLSSDHVIEQTLMKSVKGRGGLTHGRGMHDSVRHTWTSTLSIFAGFHFAMMKLNNLFDSSDDHVEIGSARIKRDVVNLVKVKVYLIDNDPFRFSDSENLIGLSSGVVARPHDSDTCGNAEDVG